MKRIFALAAAMLILLSPVLMLAGPGKVTLPHYEGRTLDNGLEVFIMETHEVPLVTIRLLIPAGSARDAQGKEGIANLTARLLMKGAAGLGADEISEAVEGVGGRLDAYASRDYTLVTGDFISRDFIKALDLLGKVVMKPDFPDDELGLEKGIITAEIKRVKENPSSMATKEFLRALIGEHPYSHPVGGSEKSVTGITRADVVDFYGVHYIPNGSILAVVGDVKWRKALKAVEKSLGDWQRKQGRSLDIEHLKMKRFPGRKVLVINKPDATQSQIRIGNIAVERDTPDYFPLLVANNILGGGFTSRLVDEIRVNRGLSYGVRSLLYHFRRGGVFFVYTFTKNQTLRETIDVALAELEGIKTEKVEKEELDKSKRYLLGLFPFDLETNGDLTSWLTELAFFGLGSDFIENYGDETGRVSPEDVQRVAGSYFHTDDCMILLLTNYEGVKDQLDGLGKIEVVDIDDVQ